MTDQRPPARQRIFITVAIIVGLAAAVFLSLAGFWTDKLWFDSVDFASVFTTTLVTKAALFVSVGAFTALMLVGNIQWAYRGRSVFVPTTPEMEALLQYRNAFESVRRLATIGGSAVFGFLAATAAAQQWGTFLLWRNAVPFGVTDPQFGLDVSFFTNTLPWLRVVLGVLSSAVVMSAIAAAAMHYIYGGFRPQSGERTSAAARVQLSVLGGAYLLVHAASLWLDRFDLAITDKSLITGLQYSDANAVLPGTTTLSGIAAVCALLFFANAFRTNWTLPFLGAGLMVISSVLIGGLWPNLVQQLQVKPNEQAKEAPYIARNIDSTRDAYGVASATIEPYTAVEEVNADAISRDSSTLASIRLMDPNRLASTFQQLQQIKGFYSFADSLDIARLNMDGKSQEAIASVREVNLDGIPESQRNWVTSTLIYTHGIGMVAAADNTVTSDGQPAFFESDIPPSGSLNIKQPRVYFGEQSPLYSIVGGPKGSKARELDYPDDTKANGQQTTTYTGKGGVPLGSALNRILFAARFSEQNILLSNAITRSSRILYVREPRARVEKVAPWLTIDSDAYPVVVGGHIVWVLDGYTTSSSYPYSQHTRLTDAVADSVTSPAFDLYGKTVNYMRNSVKATVDAYDGTVRLYEWDASDPILKSWQRAFPGTVLPKSAIPAELMPQLRYPEDLFKVQREILKRYHITDPASFFSGENFWIVPEDPTRDTGGTQPPYYLTLKAPGDKAPVFSITSTFAPAKRPSLAALLVVNSEPGPDFGRMRVLQLPSQTTIPGPVQAQNNFESNASVSSTLSLLRRGGSEVVLGNLLSLPVGGGVLYVEPVYVQATGANGYPLLRKVIVGFGQQVVMADTLDQALRAVIGVSSGTPTTGTPSTPSTGTQTAQQRLSAALADAAAAYSAGEAALKQGDFTAYGAAQKKLIEAINRAQAAQADLD
jgi:hypothetical protein